MASVLGCASEVFPLGDFRKDAYFSLTLSEQGQIIQKKVRLHVQHHDGDGHCRERETFFTCPVDLFDKKMHEFVQALSLDRKVSHHDIKEIAEELLPSPKPIFDLRERVAAVLQQNQIEFSSEQVFDVLMNAYVSSHYFQRTYVPEAVVGVSAKSAPFDFLNSDIRRANGGKARREPDTSTASVVVFPSGSGYINLPLQIALKGGTKKINPVLFIGNEPNPSISLMMRYKVHKDKRDQETHTRLIENIERVASLSVPKALKPLLIFSSPKKGVQFLAHKRQKDLYDYLLLYAKWRLAKEKEKDQEFTKIMVEGLPEHIEELCSVMMQTLACIEHFHLHGLLHNDVKPDNFLLSINDQGAIETELADYDFCCSMEKGKHSTFKGGTQLFEKRSSHVKDVESELFALGQTLSFEKRDFHYYPSFIDGFQCFLDISRRNHQYGNLIISLERAIEKLQSLANTLRYGIKNGLRTDYPTLAEIKKELYFIAEPFKL